MEFDGKYVKTLLPKRPDNGHKGTFGHALNIAGSGFYTGAAYFSSIASLKIGCGRSTLASVESVLRAVASLCPDIILLPLKSTKNKTISPCAVKDLAKVLENYSAISIGCGLFCDKDTVKFFEKLIKVLAESSKPFVVDADGLNILARLKNVKLPKNTILTPHPIELSRLLDVSLENILSQPEFWTKKCCEKYNCITVLKLHKTIVADNKGHLYINSTGNTALAHGGSGDVLCGIISGLLSQGLNCFDASILAVYMHGIVGEIASTELTEYAVLASDLIDYIPRAIKMVQQV